MPEQGWQQPELDDQQLDAVLEQSRQRAHDAVAESLDLEAGAREIAGRSTARRLPKYRKGKPTVLVVEDDRTLAQLLAEMLGRRFEVVGVAYRGDEALRMVRANPPDVITMDLGLPDTDGVTLTKIITQEHPSSRVVMATARGTRQDLLVGLAAGAVGFLSKPFSVDELNATIEEVAGGGFPIAAAIIAASLPGGGGEQPVTRLNHLFTPLEKAVLRYLADDLTVTEIAARTDLTPGEITEVQALIAEKINLRNAIENR